MSAVLHIADVSLVLVGWLVLALAFLPRLRRPASAERGRDRSYVFGILLQAAGFALVWGPRRAGGPFVPGMPVWLQVLFTLTIAGLVIGADVLVHAAVRTLGRQWSLAARVVEGHELIRTGPYAIVRHPIYAGMLGMLLATGLALSGWPALAAGTVLYVLGTWVRIATEERLLRGVFDTAYERYARAVPAFVPLPRWR